MHAIKQHIYVAVHTCFRLVTPLILRNCLVASSLTAPGYYGTVQQGNMIQYG